MFLLAQTASDSSTLSSFLPIILIGAVFYFMMFRPQRKRMKDKQALLAALAVGDEIRTIGGIHGRIRSLDDESMVVTVEDGSYFRVNRSAVAEKISRED